MEDRKNDLRFLEFERKMRLGSAGGEDVCGKFVREKSAVNRFVLGGLPALRRGEGATLSFRTIRVGMLKNGQALLWPTSPADAYNRLPVL
jgi:hypothetical protein